MNSIRNQSYWRFATQIYLRFPRAAGEPPRAKALRGPTYAFPPAGVFDIFGLLTAEAIG